MDSQKFASELFARFMPAWMWIIIGISIAGGIITGIFDLRFLIIALMIVMIIIPALIGILYYSYALSRECYINRIPHSVGIIDGALEVTLYIREYPDPAPEDNEENKEESYRIRKEVFPAHSIGKLKMKPSGIFLSLYDRHKGFLYIPYDAFDNEQDFQHFTTDLKSIYDENIKRQP